MSLLASASALLAQVPADLVPTPDEVPYLNMENYVTYTDWQHAIVSHTLVVGFAVHFAAIFYFVMTRHRTIGRYSPASVLSVVVMVSAGLLLFRLFQSFDQAFVWNTEIERWVLASSQVTADRGATFNHGYRYLNWLIDVPCLLVQLLFAFNLTARRAFSLRLQLVFSGVAMVVLGYVGQFYEATSIAPTLIWGFLSTVPYVYFSLIVWREITASQSYLPQAAVRVMQNIKLLFLFSWGLYPITYLIPVVQQMFGEVTANGVILRTVGFTVADITSKVMYGILLGKVLQIRSANEGHTPALEEFPQIEDPRRLPALSGVGVPTTTVSGSQSSQTGQAGRGGDGGGQSGQGGRQLS